MYCSWAIMCATVVYQEVDFVLGQVAIIVPSLFMDYLIWCSVQNSVYVC